MIFAAYAVLVLAQAQASPIMIVDLRPQLKSYGLPPRSQGPRPTCSVFTTVAAIEYAYAKKMGKGTPLSVEYLNWAGDNIINDHGNDGAFFHNVLAGFDKYGICPESLMPYKHPYDPARAPSAAALVSANTILNLGLKTQWIKRWNMNRPMSERQFQMILDALRKGYPVAAGSDHSRLLVGFSMDANQPGGGTFVSKDSGLGGYGEVTFEFVKTRVYDAFFVTEK